MSAPDDEPKTPAIANIKDSMRPVLPKRFYAAVTTGARDGGFAVLLDGRPVRTPAKKLLVVPSEPLAAALGDEWAAQDGVINPGLMPLTRIVNSALDGVAGREADVAAEIVKYAGGDLLLYRAEGPAPLVDRQARHWDPVIAWAEGWIGGRFMLAEGIMPVSQLETTIDGIRLRLADWPPLRLAALHVITTLTGSALLALAHADGVLDVDQAWQAANVDEDHQIAMWGRDDEAEARRAKRWSEMQAASRLLALSSA